jgi:hypothetical protein
METRNEHTKYATQSSEYILQLSTWTWGHNFHNVPLSRLQSNTYDQRYLPQSFHKEKHELDPAPNITHLYNSINQSLQNGRNEEY